MNTPNTNDFYLFQDMLKRNYFNSFLKHKKRIEFLFSSEKTVNNCSNCDIVNSELYPQGITHELTSEDKFSNLLLLIDWYIESEFNCDLEFNGYIEDENEEKLIETLQKIANTFLQVVPSHYPKQICFHTRMANIDLCKQIIDIFKNITQPIFYIHLDGYYCDPVNSEEYYQNILNYAKNKTHFYFKTNINANNIRNWIKNYKWWIINLGLDNCLNQLILEETLDNNWNYENIQDYLIFLNFQIDFLSKNFDKFEYYIFHEWNNINKPFNIQILDREILTNKKHCQDCLFHTGLTIDLNTLKIPVCAKLNYPIYHLGQIKRKNNKIIFEPLNLSLLVVKAHLKRSSTPHCEYCNYLNICEKTCYGENFKISFNPLCPIKNSCTLIQCKYNFLIYKYSQMNLFNLNDYHLDEAFRNDLLRLQKIINNKGTIS